MSDPFFKLTNKTVYGSGVLFLYISLLSHLLISCLEFEKTVKAINHMMYGTHSGLFYPKQTPLLMPGRLQGSSVVFPISESTIFYLIV